MENTINEGYQKFMKEIEPFRRAYRSLIGTLLTFQIDDKWIIYGGSLTFQIAPIGKGGILYQGEDWRIIEHHWKPPQFEEVILQALEGHIIINDERYSTQNNDVEPTISRDNPIATDEKDPPFGIFCKWYGLNIRSNVVNIFKTDNDFMEDFEKKIAIGKFPFMNSSELLKLLFPGLRYPHISSHHSPFIQIKAPTLCRFIKPNCQLRNGKLTLYLEYNSRLLKSKFRVAVIQNIPKQSITKRFSKRLPKNVKLTRKQGVTSIILNEEDYSDTLYLDLMLLYDDDVVDKAHILHLDFQPISPPFRYYELMDENSQFLKEGFKGKGKGKKGIETQKQQWAIKQLFTLMGYSCLDYGKDSMYKLHSMHEIDILAYDFFNRTILAIEVTTDNASVPGHAEKLKERIATLKEVSPGYYVQPIIITAEDKLPSQNELCKLGSYKIAIINYPSLLSFYSWAKQGGGLIWYYDQIKTFIPDEKPNIRAPMI